ncbi:hypothetical protein Ancab_001495 [Ancistrocladus abbreviatus]
MSKEIGYWQDKPMFIEEHIEGCTNPLLISFYPSVLGNDTTVAVGDAFRKSFLMSNASEDPSKKLDHSVAANSAQVTSFSANQAAAILAVLACSSNRNSSAVFRAQLNKLS